MRGVIIASYIVNLLRQIEMISQEPEEEVMFSPTSHEPSKNTVHVLLPIIPIPTAG
jgi:hypothetical protein